MNISLNTQLVCSHGAYDENAVFDEHNGDIENVEVNDDISEMIVITKMRTVTNKMTKHHFTEWHL